MFVLLFAHYLVSYIVLKLYFLLNRLLSFYVDLRNFACNFLRYQFFLLSHAAPLNELQTLHKQFVGDFASLTKLIHLTSLARITVNFQFCVDFILLLRGVLMTNKCVLTFYSLPKSANEDSYLDVWQKYVLGKVDGVACKNVFEFDMKPDQLVARLKLRSKVSKALLADIERMLDSGADYMFAASTTDGPVYGTYIADYLA
jgi:hypothetical protein